MARFEADSGSYSFGYAASWAGGGAAAIKALKTCAGRIRATARAIIDGIEGELVVEENAA